MAYMRHSDTNQVTAEMVETLARAAGLALPSEDIGALAEALGNHLASFAALDRLPLTGVNPPLEFDPRWWRAADVTEVAQTQGRSGDE